MTTRRTVGLLLAITAVALASCGTAPAPQVEGAVDLTTVVPTTASPPAAAEASEPAAGAAAPEGYQRFLATDSAVSLVVPSSWVKADLAAGDAKTIFDKATALLPPEAADQIKSIQPQLTKAVRLLVVSATGANVLVNVLDGVNPISILKASSEAQFKMLHAIVRDEAKRTIADHDALVFDITLLVHDRSIDERIIAIPTAQQTVVITVVRVIDTSVLETITNSIQIGEPA